MRIGVVFPQYEIGNDRVVIRDYVQTMEGVGCHHLTAFDHVVGANPTSYPEIDFRYTYENPFHEVFVLFGYIAGVTERLEMCSGILILPQRQTVLVAKQAAAIDVLSGGRLRLGVGNGWNPVEFVALGENFKNRGKRIEEQVELLRTLWTEELVTYDGQWHTIRDAGINPLPIQRPIPIWFGGTLIEPVMRRIARLADGWIPGFNSDREPELVARMHGYLRDAGRAPDDLKIERLIELRQGTPDDWYKRAAAYRDTGVTHVSAVPMAAGYATPAEHINAIENFRNVVADFHDPI